MAQAHSAEREKMLAALSSVLAAIGLTTFKIIVGLATGSLGILSEAAHSALDLVAALVTFFSVRAADRPADTAHRYGHGKIENFSALIETALLLLTCVWIIYEAINRLFFEEVKVDISFWAFAVMAISIVIDYSRSRILARAAKKHNSQALEADALHFSTDIWSSSVVIAGLIAVKLSETTDKLHFLHKADAIAALGVALIVIYVSIQLGKRCVGALLDTAPAGSAEQIEKTAAAIPGVLNCHRVRIRTAGPQTFVDVHLVLEGSQTLESAHTIVTQVEDAVKRLIPGADVTIHADPDSVLEKA